MALVSAQAVSYLFLELRCRDIPSTVGSVGVVDRRHLGKHCHQPGCHSGGQRDLGGSYGGSCDLCVCGDAGGTAGPEMALIHTPPWRTEMVTEAA